MATGSSTWPRERQHRLMSAGDPPLNQPIRFDPQKRTPMKAKTRASGSESASNAVISIEIENSSAKLSRLDLAVVKRYERDHRHAISEPITQSQIEAFSELTELQLGLLFERLTNAKLSTLDPSRSTRKNLLSRVLNPFGGHAGMCESMAWSAAGAFIFILPGGLGFVPCIPDSR